MKTNNEMGRLLASLSRSKRQLNRAQGDVTDWSVVKAYANEIRKVAEHQIKEQELKED